MKASTLLAAMLMLASCKSKAKDKDVAPPAECKSECVSEFGVELGSNRGVVGYSNCRPACIYAKPFEVSSTKTGLASDTYTGITWQCVEYARRWWLMQRGIVFGSVDTADEMWTEVTSAEHLASATSRKVRAYKNGGEGLPAQGDLVIYKAMPASVGLKYGHVAVVVEVNLEKGFVSLAEQNFLNKLWANPNSYARRLSLDISEGHATLVDDDAEGPIYGWLRAESPPGAGGQ